MTRQGFRASVPVMAYTLKAKATADATAGTAGALQIARLAPTR